MYCVFSIQAFSAATVAPIIAAAVAHQNATSKANKERKNADLQAKVVTNIVQSGLTVDADSGHVIIRCLWVKGGLCKIPEGKKEGDGFFTRKTDLILTPQEFAEREGYKKVHRITLLPLYREDWLALDVSKE
ncbi:hypothetical protein BGK37_11680 [Pasteurella multocida]|nr:hypothetical protein BGK37_11680 [Pasteurella multocida]